VPDYKSPAVAAAGPTFVPAPPLKRRPKLLALLAVVFAMWVGFLVYMYMKTPRPVHVVPHNNARSPELGARDPVHRL